MNTELSDRNDLYIANRVALVDYAARILGSREAAEDIVQEAYLRLAPGRRNGETTHQARAYLYRIVRNLSFDMLKRRKIEHRGQSEDPPFWTMPQPSENPEQAVMLHDEARLAAAALDSLPQEIRVAVEMYRFGGHTLEGVADHLGISVATAHRHVRAAMMKIAVALDRKNA